MNAHNPHNTVVVLCALNHALRHRLEAVDPAREMWTFLETVEQAQEWLQRYPASTLIIVEDQHSVSIEQLILDSPQLAPGIQQILIPDTTRLQEWSQRLKDFPPLFLLKDPWSTEELQTLVNHLQHSYRQKIELRRAVNALEAKTTQLEGTNHILNDMIVERVDDLLVSGVSLTTTQHLLDQLPVGVLGIEREGMVVFTNQRSEQWLQSQRQTPLWGMPLLGMTMEQVLPPTLLTLVKRLMMGGPGAPASALPLLLETPEGPLKTHAIVQWIEMPQTGTGQSFSALIVTLIPHNESQLISSGNTACE